MIYISKVRMRNFKSFKAVNIDMPRTFMCLAGPNGSGKSNYTDSIRFVLGEIALKALRAKKVKDLLHTGAKSAEVTINFDGDEQIEIKRAIRDDGKISYKLNGAKTTRSQILDYMKKYNLDDSGRNIIAQGEVARIINMGGKERRQIIDSVAGISDFESKKKESLRELDTVDTRIKEANLVLGERQAFLAELEREKEFAIRYREARTNLTNGKGTLLKTESTRLTKEYEEVKITESKFTKELETKENDIAKSDKDIADKEMERHQTSQVLQQKRQTSSLVRRIEELKASISSKGQMIEDKLESLKKEETELVEIESVLSSGEKELKALEKSLKQMQEELAKLEPLVGEMDSTSGNLEIQKLRAEFEVATDTLSSMREKLVALRSDIESKKEIIQIKQDEISRLGVGVDDLIDDYSSEINALREQAGGIADDIENSFKRTKEINVEIGEIDRKLLELKEEASIFKLRASPHLVNPALSLISTMKEKNGHGIHGTVADLIQFDPKYTQAVEAAAGGRLLYVVVDDLDCATNIINKLKQAKAGRATFVPIREVKTSKSVEHNGHSSILDVVDCKPEVRRAMEYIFAETLLVPDVAKAREIGTGQYRMVTMDGEIFERSGIVSGGRAQSSILGGNQLKKLEMRLNDMKTTKDSLISELYSIRESESSMRARKSEIEIKIKTLEMESKQQASEFEKNKTLIKTRDELKKQIIDFEQFIDSGSSELNNLNSSIITKQADISKLKTKLEDATKRYEEESAQSNKEKTALASKVSSMRATIEGKTNEIQIRRKDFTQKQKRKEEIVKDKKEGQSKIQELNNQIVSDQVELKTHEEKVTTYSKEIEALFAKLKSFEEELQALGRVRGEHRIALDRLNKDLNQLAVKKATVSTRLEDVSSEFNDYPEYTFLEDMKKEELMKIIKDSESIIASMPNVNMAAIEMFDKKKSEIEGVEEKLLKLEEERKAILEMIFEIEQHKKDAYFKTFYQVSENFKKMFTYLNIGEGYLFMDKPNDPFESGLYIKIKRGNTDHNIDSLSGGENSLIALMFIFAMQYFKPSPFYILDEVDAALDKENSKNLAALVSGMAKETQFILVSHNDVVMSMAGTVLGVTRVGGVSKLVGVKLEGKAG